VIEEPHPGEPFLNSKEKSKMFDFNDAEPQLIPAGTVAALEMSIRTGDSGEGRWLKTSKDGRSRGLDCEFTVIDGEYKNRKLWTRLTMEGQSHGHRLAGDISRRMLRAILESARGVRPDDTSEAAKAARKVGWGDLDGIRFLGRIGVEPAKGEFAAKNCVHEAITPGCEGYHRIEQANGAPSYGLSSQANAPRLLVE
jgi:hypothetical protein